MRNETYKTGGSLKTGSYQCTSQGCDQPAPAPREQCHECYWEKYYECAWDAELDHYREQEE